MRIFLALRADVASNFKTLVDSRWNVSGYFARIPCRTEAAGFGSPFTHYIAHGSIPDGKFSTLQQLLRDSTDGIRDETNWQGRAQGVSLSDARWAIAFQSSELVAAYFLTIDGETVWRTPRDAMSLLGLVPTRRDVIDEVTQ